jgi:galactokinase
MASPTAGSVAERGREGRRTRAFGPGRVNLIGEHTDYNDGLCLPFAITHGVTVTIEDDDDRLVRAHAADLDEHDEFEVGKAPPATGWRAFVRGMVTELARAGHPVRGGRVAITGSVPQGSGLSSSAALEVALVLALLDHSGATEPDRRDLARLCSRVENEWVGAQTGLLDQMAALFGREGHAIRLDIRGLAVEPVPLALAGWRLVTVDSGVEHVHAASGYNERRRECRAACEALGIASLRDADPEAAAALPPPLDRRGRHLLGENERVDRAVAALRHSDLGDLARLIDASHASLRDLYEVSVPAVEATRDRLKAGGAAGVRMVGGGFGGSLLALLPPGVEPPPGALAVAPGPAARLL